MNKAEINGNRGVDEPICMIDAVSNKTYYYHFDSLGSVVSISDDGGQMTEKYEYDVFGAVTIRDSENSVLSVSSVANPYMFTGRNYDTETGLYYYRARYYSPKIGRFLQTDPIGYKDSMNLYIYVGNNPLNWIDPWGLEKVDRDSTSWIEHYGKLWKYRDDVLNSAIASGLLWGDVLGGFGEFGRNDTFDPEYLDSIINSHPWAGKTGVSGLSENVYGVIHISVGFGFGLAGIDRTSAYNILRTWERTEAVAWPGNTPLIHRDHQGRNWFEDGQVGIDRDMRDGMAGYEIGKAIRDYLEY